MFTENGNEKIFLGKTVILRKKAFMVKDLVHLKKFPPGRAPNVYYIVLTSCDKYGKPEFPTSLFDGATKRSFKKHKIHVITVHDLLTDFRKAHPNWDGKSDLFQRSSEIDLEKDQHLNDIFNDTLKKLLAHKIDNYEFLNMMEQNGIHFPNAAEEAFRRQNDPDSETSNLPDVLVLLFSFIKRHHHDNIFVDEVPIPLSSYSKFKIFTFE